MSYFVLELFFDAETELALRNIWQQMDAMPDWTPPERGDAWPHISISSTPVLDVSTFDTMLRATVANSPTLSVQLARVETFISDSAVLFLAPIATTQLLSIHAELIDALRSSGGLIPNLHAPGSWVPHCTLAMHLPLELVPKSIELVSQQQLPIVGRIERVGLVEISPQGSSYLAVYPLRI